jgi:holo-[acyl-carrier protein] synthase
MTGLRGVGVDLVAFAHLERVFSDSFRDAVFTPAEIEYAEASGRPVEHYATAFAGKEATCKAIGTGWTRGRDVEISRAPSGQPRVRFDGDLSGRDGSDLLLSLSADGEYAVGVAIYR